MNKNNFHSRICKTQRRMGQAPYHHCFVFVEAHRQRPQLACHHKASLVIRRVCVLESSSSTNAATFVCRFPNCAHWVRFESCLIKGCFLTCLNSKQSLNILHGAKTTAAQFQAFPCRGSDRILLASVFPYVIPSGQPRRIIAARMGKTPSLRDCKRMKLVTVF